jgi:hypothetical protein
MQLGPELTSVVTRRSFLTGVAVFATAAFRAPCAFADQVPFEARVRRGLRQRLGQVPVRDYEHRLAHELAAICSSGWQPRFEVAEALTASIRSRGLIVGPGRGSAPSSLVAYSLGLTQVDPIEGGLMFECFGFRNPVFRIDVEPSIRREWIEEAIEPWKTSGVRVWFAPRALTLDGPPSIPSQPDPCVELYPSPVLTAVRESFSFHGRDVGAIDVTDLSPFFRPAGSPQPFGFEVAWCYTCAADYEAVLESQRVAAQTLLDTIRPTRFQHLAAVLGLMGGVREGIRADFVARHLGWRRAVPFSPRCASFVEDTFGLLVYREQLIHIASCLAGLSARDGEEIVRSLGKRQPKSLSTWKVRFMDGAAARGAISRTEAVAIWAHFERIHPDFGLCSRADSLGRAMLSLWSAHAIQLDRGRYVRALRRAEQWLA